MDMDRVAKLADSIWKRREAINSRMDEIAKYVHPDRAGFTVKRSPEQEGREDIWDATPEDAALMLASALGGLLTNPSSSWFALEQKSGEELPREGTEWLEEVTRKMLAAFADPATGFYNESDAFYLDLPVFGWAVFWSEYQDGKGLRFRALPPAECAITEDADGRVDALVRRYSLTAAQMREEFGDAVSDAVKSAAGNDSGREFTVTHVVMGRDKLPEEIASTAHGAAGDAAPNGQLDDPAPGNAGTGDGRAARTVHPFVSIYFETESKRLLHQGGYFELPFQAPRWSKRSGEVYGRGPGHTALPDMRVLNTVSMAQLTAAEKQADPPILVPDDGVLGKINTHSGGITYYTPGAGDRIAPLPVAANLDVMETIITRRQDAIRSAFLNDRIQLAGGPQMTATEYAGRERRQMMILGPVMGRLQSEYLGPLVERVFALLYRAGVLPPAPDAMKGQELLPRYVSPIARAQKQGEAESLSKAFAFLAPVIQTNPQVLDNFDADAIVRDSQEVFGYAQSYLRAKEDVDKERKARAEAAQQAAAMEAGMAGGMPPAAGGAAPGPPPGG